MPDFSSQSIEDWNNKSYIVYGYYEYPDNDLE